MASLSAFNASKSVPAVARVSLLPACGEMTVLTAERWPVITQAIRP
jgi:hypothetical protein